jgi:hypothetical protein
LKGIDGNDDANNSRLKMNPYVNRGCVNAVQSKARLFLLPGMNHCQGGNATDRFDAIGDLPERSIANLDHF